MIAHVRFALQLYRHSGRWLAPLTVLVIWFGFAIENAPETFDSLAALFPAFLVISCWVAASLGDVDDRNHREMAAAAAGSSSRLHQARLAASFLFCASTAALQVVFITFARDQPGTSTPVVLLVSFATLIGASALGAAIGSCLHAPIVNRRAVALPTGFVAVMLIVLLPPVQDALQRLGTGEVGRALVLSAIALVLAAAGAAASSAAAQRV